MAAVASSLLVPLPPLVAKCIRHLSSPALLSVPDLFASGIVDLHHVGGALLRAEFDAESASLSLDNPHHVACALALFFADLPHPLATATLHDCFLDAAAVPDAKERLACWVAVVRLLPPPHFTLLRALTAYLREYCTRGAGSIDDCIDAFAPFLLWSRDDSAVAALRPPPELDVDDAESVVVVVVQSALQTAQLVLLGHLWTVQEAVNHIVASMPRCDAALHWRLELHDGTPLDPDELVGVLDFAPMDTLYIETVDEMLEPDYVAVSRALLRSLVLECDGMLNLPSNSASTTPRTSSDQYGFVPRSSGESSATSASAFDAEFDAILDTVALDLDDDDAPSPTTPQSPARTTSSGSGQYGWIGSVRETPKPMSAEARQVRRKLRQTVTRSRMVLKAEHLIDAPVERRSRDLALRATPAHYLRAPPRSNDAIDSHAPPVRPRGPPPKKPVMQTRKKRVKAASPLAAIMSAPPSEPTQPPPVARPGQPPRPTLSSSPLHAPAPVARPVSPAAPPPVARPASLDAYQSPRSGAPVTPTRRGPRVAAATTAAIVARPPISPAAAASPVRPASRPGATAKPLPAPPSGANSAKPHRPTAPPPRTTAAATLPSSFRAPSPLPRPAAPAAATLVYSNLPPSSSSSGDGYDNLPAHTLRIQRANMGLAPEDEGLEIEVFDDSLLSQLQQ